MVAESEWEGEATGGGGIMKQKYTIWYNVVLQLGGSYAHVSVSRIDGRGDGYPS